MTLGFSEYVPEHLLIRAMDEDRAARQANDPDARRAHEALARHYRARVTALGGIPAHLR